MEFFSFFRSNVFTISYYDAKTFSEIFIPFPLEHYIYFNLLIYLSSSKTRTILLRRPHFSFLEFVIVRSRIRESF